MTETYIIEVQSFANLGLRTKYWHEVARFKKGDPSRFDKPFDANVAIKEFESYNHGLFITGKPTGTRLIIEIVK